MEQGSQQKTLEYMPQANVMSEEYPEVGACMRDEEEPELEREEEVTPVEGDSMTVLEDHPFEMNKVMKEILDEEEQEDRSLEDSNPGTLHCFPTEEEETTKDECPLPYPVPGLVEDQRALIVGKICEGELEAGNNIRKESEGRKWLIDSGASSHYIKETTKFRAFKWLHKPVSINTGKGPIWGIARGEVEVVMSIGKVVFGGVLLVPDLDVDSDLLSVTALIRAGFGMNFEGDKGDIHKNKRTWGTASPIKNNGGLCYLEEYEKVEQYALAAQYVDTQRIDTWHKRLGHLNSRAVRSLVPKVPGIEIRDLHTRIGERNIDCVDCLKGTQQQTISRYSFAKGTRPLERVSADIAGPMKCADITWKYKYLLVIVNHYTRYTWVFPLISRDMALRAVQV